MNSITQVSKHTPGPWLIDTNNFVDGFRIYTGRFSGKYEKRLYRGAFICAHNGADSFPIKERPQIQANAQLIIAAPDMLEALKKVQYWLGDSNEPLNPYSVMGQLQAKVDAAIIKAEGGVE